MRLSELTLPELLTLANFLLRMAEDIPVEDQKATKEARDEITYVMNLIAEKEGSPEPSLRHDSLN
jgi:hypothetical protein